MTGPAPLHATCVAIFGARGWSGVLLLGPSGSGKSDLALRLMQSGARLVADDATVVWAQDGTLHAACPDAIAGRMEIRGLGIVEAPTRRTTPLALVIRCLTEPPERLPELATWTHQGIGLPSLDVDVRSPSAAAVVDHALSLIR